MQKLAQSIVSEINQEEVRYLPASPPHSIVLQVLPISASASECRAESSSVEAAACRSRRDSGRRAQRIVRQDSENVQLPLSDQLVSCYCDFHYRLHTPQAKVGSPICFRSRLMLSFRYLIPSLGLVIPLVYCHKLVNVWKRDKLERKISNFLLSLDNYETAIKKNKTFIKSLKC